MNANRIVKLNMIMLAAMLLACSFFSGLAPQAATQTATIAPSGTATSTNTPIPLPPTETPIPAPSRPAAPKAFTWEVLCKENTRVNPPGAYVTLTWADVDGETGYRIYKQGELVAELESNMTKYEGLIVNYNWSRKPYREGAAVYGIAAFNDSGPSEKVEVNVAYYCRTTH